MPDPYNPIDGAIELLKLVAEGWSLSKTGQQGAKRCIRELQLIQPGTTQGGIVAAIRTLNFLGYTYHGGEQWQPPLGPAPLPEVAKWPFPTDTRIDIRKPGMVTQPPAMPSPGAIAYQLTKRLVIDITTARAAVDAAIAAAPIVKTLDVKALAAISDEGKAALSDEQILYAFSDHGFTIHPGDKAALCAFAREVAAAGVAPALNQPQGMFPVNYHCPHCGRNEGDPHMMDCKYAKSVVQRPRP